MWFIEIVHVCLCLSALNKPCPQQDVTSSDVFLQVCLSYSRLVCNEPQYAGLYCHVQREIYDLLNRGYSKLIPLFLNKNCLFVRWLVGFEYAIGCTAFSIHAIRPEDEQLHRPKVLYTSASFSLGWIFGD